MKARDFYFATEGTKYGTTCCEHDCCRVAAENARLRERLEEWLALADSGIVPKVLSLMDRTRVLVER